MWRVCLDDYEVLELLVKVAQDFARADIPAGTRVSIDGGSQGNCNRNLIQKIGCKDVGPPIRQTGRGNLCAVSVRFVNKGWNGLRRTCNQSSR